MIHYFNKTTMAYTACYHLPMNVKCADNAEVNCPDCLRALTPQQVNGILSRLGPEEAFDFLGTLGHVRSAQIYNGA